MCCGKIPEEEILKLSGKLEKSQERRMSRRCFVKTLGLSAVTMALAGCSQSLERLAGLGTRQPNSDIAQLEIVSGDWFSADVIFQFPEGDLMIHSSIGDWGAELTMTGLGEIRERCYLLPYSLSTEALSNASAGDSMTVLVRSSRKSFKQLVESLDRLPALKIRDLENYEKVKHLMKTIGKHRLEQLDPELHLAGEALPLPKVVDAKSLERLQREWDHHPTIRKLERLIESRRDTLLFQLMAKLGNYLTDEAVEGLVKQQKRGQGLSYQEMTSPLSRPSRPVPLCGGGGYINPQPIPSSLINIIIGCVGCLSGALTWVKVIIWPCTTVGGCLFFIGTLPIFATAWGFSCVSCGGGGGGGVFTES